ncbi:MAG: sulfotransferase family protein [Salinivenus sp.]
MGEPMTLSNQIEKRVFIVGCSRSGTTVLQVSVASHPRITSFPETFFFQRLPGWLGRPPLWLGIANEQARPVLREVLNIIGRPDLEDRIPTSWRLRPYVETYLDILDQEALRAGTDLWVEKTPTHVHRLSLILSYVPKVHIIHMIRDGRDVVGSICHRAHTYSDSFSDKQKDPAFGIKRWNRALRESTAYLGQPGHTFVVYDQFVQDPEPSLRRICRDLDIEYAPQMRTGTEEAAKTVIPEQKKWIERAKTPPEPRESKFEKMFSPSEQKRIEERLNLELFDRVLRKLA